MHASAEWALSFSRQQQVCDLLALLLFLILSVYLLWPLAIWMIAALVMLLSVSVMVLKRIWQRDISSVGYRPEGLAKRWWLEINDHRYNVRWRDGSVRQRDCVVLCWSFWPWDRLILRADSFVSAEEFRRFRAELYGEI
ncbi:hypothetical protein [Bacterioplanoides sp.]|uniref:hypothetical protein n=1 Tax=Bacterioplanoides sp. TaxID=2066072 RepID=UPI003B00F06D